MLQLLTKSIVILLLAYAAICIALFVFQRNLLYFPQPASPNDRSEKLALKTDAGDVLVTVRDVPGDAAIIYFGGNGENVTNNLDSFAAAFPHHALYLMNYRGYGGSEGKPTEAAIFSDAAQLFDLAHRKHANVVAIGRSLGSGVAVHLATERPVQKLILVTPYDSIEEVAASQFAFFPVRLLLLDKYESKKYAATISVPTLLIEAEKDEVIANRHTRNLLAGFRPGVATLKVVQGAQHNTIGNYPDYLKLIQSGL